MLNYKYVWVFSVNFISITDCVTIGYIEGILNWFQQYLKIPSAGKGHDQICTGVHRDH